ncbi:MAG: thioredoxin-disulfide reductase [Candidatus Pacebacteria bacterium CG_4_9_14_3_um_filter_40_12]|nr:thioredoxin-disulfide reductase [Candidatus Paceibacterota bacterium]PIR63946.1 MAG: thioredoxin-disulfide reductase [Candidatus Pacebacteria bacterium CG10_big_fil_rev_8_21_14_0_10_40_26]PIZ78645.1 MAG: thioredoxin-disulfide reductase [Candidatus Pacebacteria bacterium CG_4_10_14_0_2_um_filter_40_20]PJA68503.1 MAG: thioredoxin-disulfide reductase [Candidatus Pacebacteria bacterium CG_4_9_14_3_um_filter_40_12]PJC41868.1 MAG: thioredoxin-disulfide reductase [Candidatus Pacebacteria bacterium 
MSKKVQVAVIGSGPAGYTAAIYTSRAQLETTVFAGYQSGGQLMFTTDVENFPGFPEGIMGPKMMMQFRTQAERFGTSIVDMHVTAVDLSHRPFKIWTTLPEGTDPQKLNDYTPEQQKELAASIKASEPEYVANSIIISTGASPIKPGVTGEAEFSAKGVSYCAVCDAAFFRDKETYVVGGGDSAMEDALALAKFSKHVTVIHRRDSFKASKIMQERVLGNEKISVLWNTTLEEIIGDQKVTGVRVKENGEEKVLSADGVFIAIGHRPQTSVFVDQVELDGHGYVVTRQSATEVGVTKAQAALSEGLVQYPSMTSVEGVFAAGDNVDVRYKQAITAAGQGCAAALDAERWLERQES